MPRDCAATKPRIKAVRPRSVKGFVRSGWKHAIAPPGSGPLASPGGVAGGSGQ
jgi:hypothetical protein